MFYSCRPKMLAKRKSRDRKRDAREKAFHGLCVSERFDAAKTEPDIDHSHSITLSARSTSPAGTS
jgi:hypothetical protein